MGITLDIHQIAVDGSNRQLHHTNSGEIGTEKAFGLIIKWLNPTSMLNAPVKLHSIGENELVVHFTYGMIIEGCEELNEGIDNHYRWSYTFTGTPNRFDLYWRELGICADFVQLKTLVLTYAMAWHKQFPTEFENVLESLKVHEWTASPVMSKD